MITFATVSLMFALATVLAVAADAAVDLARRLRTPRGSSVLRLEPARAELSGAY